MKKKKTKKHEANEIKKTIRKQKQGMQKTVPEKCIGCNYGNGIYCFPCMNDILSKRGD